MVNIEGLTTKSSGHSVVVLIPAHYVRKYGIKLGDDVSVSIKKVRK